MGTNLRQPYGTITHYRVATRIGKIEEDMSIYVLCAFIRSTSKIVFVLPAKLKP